jgi:hypothetical protein
MDQEPAHPNDPDGRFADAAAARRRLAELDEHAEAQRQLPGLRAKHADVLRRKQQVAEAIATYDTGGVHGLHRGGASEQDPTRQALVEQLRALNLELDAVNAAIAAIPAPLAHSDRNAHLEDLQRRVGNR